MQFKLYNQIFKAVTLYDLLQLVDPDKIAEEAKKKEIPEENVKEKATKAFTEHSSDEDSDQEGVSVHVLARDWLRNYFNIHSFIHSLLFSPEKANRRRRKEDV